MGQVYRAHDTGTNRVVALKVLAAHLAGNPVYQERFRREAQAAARLNEPHVLPIHDFGEIDGRLFLDMRLVEGHDLAAVLARDRLTPLRVVHHIEQVAAALDSAHRTGLVHRDVKPSNILVAADDFTYLIDFGIARGVGDSALTSTGFAIGTFDYMAPERFSTERCDARSDVYSLACVLFESLTGSKPFPYETLERKIAAHLAEPPPRPSLIVPQLTDELDAVIARGMAKDPFLRYPSAGALASAARMAVANATARAGQIYSRTAPTQVNPYNAPSSHAVQHRSDNQRIVSVLLVTTAVLLIVGIVVGLALFQGETESIADSPTTESTAVPTQPITGTTSVGPTALSTTAQTPAAMTVTPPAANYEFAGTWNGFAQGSGSRFETIIKLVSSPR